MVAATVVLMAGALFSLRGLRWPALLFCAGALLLLAGISITFISMRPAAQMWEAAWIGLPVLAIILIGFFTDVKLPFGIPTGLGRV